MIKRTLEQIEVMAEGKLVPGVPRDKLISGVSTDSRAITTGCLFVPLIGDVFNGHSFVTEAFAKGAAASLWQQDQGEPPADMPVIIVENCLTALQKLATAYRNQLTARVIAITGSNGKTTTKDMTAAILSTTYKVHKTEGNLNNHIGLPLTLLQMDESTEMAVLEMGMSGRGEIELLTGLAQPEAAIITNIGDAHLLQLGSREEIARAKCEILSGLKEDGFFAYNGDDPLIDNTYPSMPQPNHFLRYRFGSGPQNDLYPLAIMLDHEGQQFRINWPDAPGFSLPLLGEHNVINALGAIAVCKYMGVQDKDIVEGLRNLKVSAMRIESIKASCGALLLNDAYNANPSSMKAAIQLVHTLKGYHTKMVVLGDMLELGERELEFHLEIGRMLDPAQIDYVFAYGPLAYHIMLGAKEVLGAGKVQWFEDKNELVKKLSSMLSPGDLVLFKASRGMKLEEVIQAVQ
ncbi:UDP-N-acetylmuramoyl-tripeptide--D-alanyl-D-alanine ligase [Paenibacillus senegalensis]|uniref:UDP-N-acetylmuramoyl-tripeptide--D-alanyl-D- alanine ligase n=1 Tax=Paenibacillus senegalensis TaxID=1465766 RepID=UPI000288BB46|nr:UDP-N-acetylmuramoyl-tripeptide--D-alanyl-D-alanine ligase [Paenibacillus senegalensis]